MCPIMNFYIAFSYILIFSLEVKCHYVQKEALNLRKKNVMIKQFAHNLYGQLNSGKGFAQATFQEFPYPGVENSDTVRTVAGRGNGDGSRASMTFDLPAISQREVIRHVEVRIPGVKILRSVVYLVIKKGNRVLKSVVHTQRKSTANSEHHMVIDLSSHVRPYMNRFQDYLQVEVSLPWNGRGADVNREDFLLVLYSQDPTFRQILIEKYQNQLKEKKVNLGPSDKANQKLARQKREIILNNSTVRRRRRRKCHKRSFYVDFEHIGWSSWIVRPLRFNAKICKGVCAAPVDQDLAPTNHAILQSLMRVGLDSDEPRPPMPCCVPTKLKPLNMIYYEGDNQIVVRRHEDMVVEECGCR